MDAFTTETFGGNPVGVIPHAENLTDEEMLNIANELNLSETAFLYHQQMTMQIIK